MLVEAQVPIAREMYAAVLNDPARKGPLLLFSAEGGMDIEEIADRHPDALVRLPVDIRKGLDSVALRGALPKVAGLAADALADLLQRLYTVYADNDAELVEINPLVADEGRATGRARLQARRSTTAACRGARRWPSRARPRS